MEESTTLQRIREAAREEFLAKGYKSAALRKIAEKAEVTTGALYGYFPDKMSIFKSMVDEPASGLVKWFSGVQREFSEMPPDYKETRMHEHVDRKVTEFMDYIYDNFDAFKLIICCSEGTEYANYIDVLADIEVEYTKRYLDMLVLEGVMKEEVEESFMHIVENAYFSSIFETVKHDMEREKAKHYIERLTGFFSAGWDTLLKE